MKHRYQPLYKVAAAACGLLVFVLLFGLAALMILQFNQDRQSARYPGALPLSSHSNYSGLPFEYRWDDSYLAYDGFNEVYNWYSVNYNLGAESRANDRCILLDGVADRLSGERVINVILCNTPDGQMVYVTRHTILNGREGVIAGLHHLQAILNTTYNRASQ